MFCCRLFAFVIYETFAIGCAYVNDHLALYLESILRRHIMRYYEDMSHHCSYCYALALPRVGVGSFSFMQFSTYRPHYCCLADDELVALIDGIEWI